MTRSLVTDYEAFYRDRAADHVYPVEFVVRAFLGSYPNLPKENGSYRGTRVLDLGFGDGRNMPLLFDLGMQVHGVEISEEICVRTAERMRRLGVSVTAQVGRSTQLPFEDEWFDHVLACHSCYYIDPGTQFSDNVREIARVMRRGGRLVLSAPMGSSFIMRGARDLGDGHMEIVNDPYGVRNGHVLKKFDRGADLEDALAPAFTDLRIGACRNDFWGLEEDVWIVVCRRR